MCYDNTGIISEISTPKLAITIRNFSQQKKTMTSVALEYIIVLELKEEALGAKQETCLCS